MNSTCSIFSSIPGLAVLVDQTIETTSEFYSKRMIERFIANNYFQNWFTVEFVQANNVNLEEYQHMPLYNEQLCLRFHLDGFYVENLYFKFLPGWFIANMEKIICQSKAFVTLFMRNGMLQSNIYLIIDHNGHLISIY
jgi:hypothetical protein